MQDIEIKRNFDIKKLTSFKIGGEADCVYFPKNQSEFINLLKNLKKFLVLGNWSNVLVSSLGVKDDIISTLKLNNIEIKGTKVVVDCGVKGQTLSKSVQEKGLSGFEFMIGFPGTVGGNIFMNASAHNQTISDFLISACVFDLEKKEVRVLNKRELKFSYRHSILQEKPYILLSAEFDLKREKPDIVQELMNRNLEFRKSHQPNLALPNAGSVFKNPENDSAGRLLDRVGAKDFKIGGACVWTGHANFIVNEANATSSDVLNLMFKMYNEVKNKYTIELEPEIRFIGKKTKEDEKICNIMYKQK